VVLVGALGGLLVAIALHVAGRRMAADTALPLGTCLAAAAWPVFLIAGFG
jgi:leader peptidase (prepilin peptidase)/N-methyltransferase